MPLTSQTSFCALCYLPRVNTLRGGGGGAFCDVQFRAVFCGGPAPVCGGGGGIVLREGGNSSVRCGPPLPGRGGVLPVGATPVPHARPDLLPIQSPKSTDKRSTDDCHRSRADKQYSSAVHPAPQTQGSFLTTRHHLGGGGGAPPTQPPLDPPCPSEIGPKFLQLIKIFLLPPSVPISLDQKLCSAPSAPLKTQHHCPRFEKEPCPDAIFARAALSPSGLAHVFGTGRCSVAQVGARSACALGHVLMGTRAVCAPRPQPRSLISGARCGGAGA